MLQLLVFWETELQDPRRRGGLHRRLEKHAHVPELEFGGSGTEVSVRGDPGIISKKCFFTEVLPGAEVFHRDGRTKTPHLPVAVRPSRQM